MNQMNVLRSYALRHYTKRLERLKYTLKYTNHSKRKERLIKRIKYDEKMIDYYNEKMIDYYTNTIFMTRELIESNNEALSNLQVVDVTQIRGGRGHKL